MLMVNLQSQLQKCLMLVGCSLFFSTLLAGPAKADICTPTKVITAAEANKPLPRTEIVKTLPLEHYVTGIAWSPDGHYLATSEDFDMIVKIWDTSDYHIVHTIKKVNLGDFHLLFTADGKYLITSSQKEFDGKDRTAISVLDVATGENVKNVEGPNDPSLHPLANMPHDFALSPDGKRLYVTFSPGDNLAHIYDTTTWNDIGTFSTIATSMQGGPENDQLTILDVAKGNAHVWSLSKQTFIQNFPITDKLDIPQGGTIVDAAACRMVSGIGMRTLTCVDKCDGKVGIKPILKSSGDVFPIRTWDLNTGSQLDAFRADEKTTVQELDLSPDGGLLVALVSADKEKSAVLHNAYQLSSTKELFKFKRYGWSAKFSPDNRYLAVAGDSEVIIFVLGGSK
jgi:WD40 repeat protein